MIFKTVSNEKLLARLKALVHQEREVLTDILQHLLEVENRRLHLEEGYGSIFEYAVQVLKYSEAQAYRRISAMRLLREIPEIKKSVEAGSLNLTHLAQAKKYFKTEADHLKPLSKEQKLRLLQELENKTTRQTEKIFAELNPDSVPEDRARVIRGNLTEIRFVASDVLMEKLNRFKELDSHVLHNANYAELFERLVDLALKTKEKVIEEKVSQPKQSFSAKIKSSEKTIVKNGTKVFVAPKKISGWHSSTTEMPIRERGICNHHNNDGNSGNGSKHNSNNSSDENLRSRVIPIQVKRTVMKRDHASCSFVNSVTGKRCGSKYKLQYEHRKPFAKGGTHDAENVTIFCQSHNLFMAEKQFGREKIRQYRADFH